jgi:hypothetical protein
MPDPASPSDTDQHRIELGLGAYLLYSFTGPSAIAFQLFWESIQLGEGTVDEATPSAQVHVDVDVAKADLTFTLDAYLGQLFATGTVEVWDLLADPPAWKTIASPDHSVVTLFDPTKGMIDGSPTAFPLELSGPWGPNGPSGSGVTRFHIAAEPRVLAPVGPIVKQKLFADSPPLVLNIVASCGSPASVGAPGVYGDPDSPWFNVFFGTYQMDCATTDGWKRPFGYETASGVDSALHGEDIARIGSGDWNWFSNYMYGVPVDVCDEYSTINMSKVTFEGPTPVVLGTSTWHQVTMKGVVVASAYESDAPGARQLVENSLLTNEWRTSFGLPSPRADHTTSFIGTELESTVLMTYWQDDTGYHTLMFGGTCVVGVDPAFLGAQVAAAAAAITAHYPSRGFPA